MEPEMVEHKCRNQPGAWMLGGHQLLLPFFGFNFNSFFILLLKRMRESSVRAGGPPQ